VEPDAVAAFNLDDPEFVAAYVRITAEHFLAGFRFIDVAPDMELFIDRNAGLMVLFTILLAGKADDTVPPRRPVPLSISAIANRFGVSRPHVRALLRDAEEGGLIRRDDAGHVAVLPRLAEAAESFIAVALLFVAMCAREAHAEVYGGDSPA
jgi:hypothetical protein